MSLSSNGIFSEPSPDAVADGGPFTMEMEPNLPMMTFLPSSLLPAFPRRFCLLRLCAASDCDSGGVTSVPSAMLRQPSRPGKQMMATNQ